MRVRKYRHLGVSVMARFKNPARGRLFTHVRKHQLKYVAILPSLVTLLNAIFGFAAIGMAARGATSERFFFHKPELTYFAMAGYMIFIAMIADMLDGRLARMSKSTSSFGGQLDSLCDMVSFGIAPAFLMLKFLEGRLSTLSEIKPAFGGPAAKFVWLCAAIYMACAAIRLARFNVENEEDESAHMSFWGLPSPAAAGVVASIVVFQQDLLPSIADTGTFLYRFADNTILYALPFITLAAGILMITRIRYPHLVNQFIRGKKPFANLIWGLLGLAIGILNPQGALALAFCGFAAWGLIHWLYQRLKGKKSLFEMQRHPLFETDRQNRTENDTV
jgi:CDP-diacylglycerol--serine O-phosphatidyltransferase